jgi:hypothetical protein
MNRYRLKTPLKLTAAGLFEMSSQADMLGTRGTGAHVTTDDLSIYRSEALNSPFSVITVTDWINEAPAVPRKLTNRSYQQSMAVYNYRKQLWIHREHKATAVPRLKQRTPSALSITRNLPSSPISVHDEGFKMTKDFAIGVRASALELEALAVTETHESIERKQKNALAKEILYRNRSPFRIHSYKPKHLSLLLRCPPPPLTYQK